MADGLSPALALDYLAELTVDVRAAAVREAATGVLRAGEGGVQPGPGVVTVTGEHWAMSARLGPLADAELVAGDLRRIVGDLDRNGFRTP